MFTVALFAVVAPIVALLTFARYLDKQQELHDIKSRLSTVQEHNAEPERRLRLWKDDDYVRTQTRKCLGYVMPGQTLYIVTDPLRGMATERLQRKVGSANRKRRAATPWYTTMRDSVKIAGQSEETGSVDDAPVVRRKGGANK